jgi:putative transposase
MTDNKKMQVAVFRFGVIREFVTGAQISRAEKGQLLADKCVRKWHIPFSEKTQISKGTIQRWRRLYEGSNGELKSLCHKDRSDIGHSRAMDDDTCKELVCLRKKIPVANVPQLIEQMKQRKLVTPGTVLNNSTVYRFLHHQNLMDLAESRLADSRRWEAKLPNDLWQSIVMHGPRIDVDGMQKKTYLVAILDDYSRLIVYARFYLSTILSSYLDALESALSKRGLPRKLYVHNGLTFRRRQLEYITASLSISLIEPIPNRPEGKRKIGMWVETIQSRFLPYVSATTLPELNKALDQYLNDDYHKRKLSVTGQTPLDRFTSQMSCLRSVPENLKDYFRTVALRKVNKDRSITLYGRIYKAPVALIGKRVEVMYHEDEPGIVEVKYQNESHGVIRPLNHNVNYRVKREIDECKQIALFRYGIISDFVNRKEILKYGEQKKLLRSKYNCNWRIPFSNKTRISISIIIHWIKRYNESGGKIESLYPQRRSDIGQSRVMDTQTANNLIYLTKNSDISTVRKILSEMNCRGLVTPGTSLTFPTVYRFLCQTGSMDYLKMRKKRNLINSRSIEDDSTWMQKIQQNKIPLIELQYELSLKADPEDIDLLYNCNRLGQIIYRKRALTILSYYKGIPINSISEHFLIPKQTILNQLRLLKKNGLKGVMKIKRRKVRKFEDPKYTKELFKILHAPPVDYGFNRTSWRHDDIKKIMDEQGLKISKANIGLIIKNSGFKSKKARIVLTSNDPEYKQKVQVIKNILSNLGSKEKFFSIDEYGPFAIKIYGGRSLVPPGQTKTVPQWQKNKGSLIITAALELSTNQVTHFYSEGKNTIEMIKLLEILISKYESENCIYFSWDAASWHASKKFKNNVKEINSDEFRKNRRVPIVKLAPLPTGAQFLNVIESVFSGMAKAIIHNSDYPSDSECKNAIDKYFEERNEKFIKNLKRAGNKIWGNERVKPVFDESNNCKDPMYR